MMLLDMCHYLVDAITQQHNFPNVQAASQLRVTRTDLTAMLSAQMYSYWDSAPAGPGVYELLRSWVKQQQEAEGGTRKKRAAAASSAGGGMARVLHLLVENELRHWPHQRVTGTFFFAKETASGAAVLVDQRTQKVYEVLGISTSIGDIMRSGGRFTKDDVLGATIKLTLLPYMAKIVYDGTLFGAPPAGASEAAEARAAAEAAEAEGTVLRELPAHVESLVGKRVDISGLSGRPELNGTTGTATAWVEAKGRYAVRLADGETVALKMANLAVSSQQAASDSGRPPAASELSASERQAQERLRALRQRKGDAGFWTFRRMGYTEAENPQHVAAILGGDGTMVGMVPPCAALAPTSDEILSSLVAAATAAGARPSMLATDEKSIVERLQQVLGAVGIQAGYYPPPSEEELASMGSPHTLGV